MLARHRLLVAQDKGSDMLGAELLYKIFLGQQIVFHKKAQNFCGSSIRNGVVALLIGGDKKGKQIDCLGFLSRRLFFRRQFKEAAV